MKSLKEFLKESIDAAVSNIPYYEESNQTDSWSIGITTSDSSVSRFNRLDSCGFIDHSFMGDLFIYRKENEILGRNYISKEDLKCMFKLDESDYNKAASAASSVIDKANDILGELWKNNLTTAADYTFTPMDRSTCKETDGEAYIVAVDVFETGFSVPKGIAWHFISRKGNKWTGIGISGHQHILSDNINCAWFMTDQKEYKDFPYKMGDNTFGSNEYRVYKTDKSSVESYIKKIEALRKEAVKTFSLRNTIKSAAGDTIMKSMTAYNRRLR